MKTLQRNRGWRAAAGALMASSLVLLGGCGKQTTPVPETQGTTPVAAEPAKPDADARFEIISARAEMSLGQLALTLEFPRALVGTQSFDDLISVKDSQGATVSGSWALNEDGKTLRFPFVQANASYNVQVKAELAAIDGETLGSQTSKDIFTGPLEPAVGFAAQGSVLPARETRGLPVVSVNVNEVDVEFLRVHDNELANFFA
ncbi:MAG: alpha-2-macroglobulin family protein, partial [Rhodanobacteraceae bacterium]|nr:alpha-2-macroglobulin family protein [Rhodanobacteraceae bacterium]